MGEIAIAAGILSLGAGVHREMELMVAAGLTPMQAIQAATRRIRMVIKDGKVLIQR